MAIGARSKNKVGGTGNLGMGWAPRRSCPLSAQEACSRESFSIRANDGERPPLNLATGCFNKVLLKQRCTHSYTYSLWLLSNDRGALSSCDWEGIAHRPKIFIIWTFEESLPTPVLDQWYLATDPFKYHPRKHTYIPIYTVEFTYYWSYSMESFIQVHTSGPWWG